MFIRGETLSALIIHQIFPLARDWSKHVMWPNIPQLKLGNIREYSLIIRIINTMASIWLRKYARLFVLEHYLFLKAHSFRSRFSEQIMSADKYPSIFSRQVEAIVYIYCPSEGNTWMDITRPWKCFCKQASLEKVNNWNCTKVKVKFYIWLSRLSSK